MDITFFDEKIAAVTPALEQAKTDLDNDPTTIALKQYSKKGDTVRTLAQTISDLESKKIEFVSIQSQIDTKTQEIADLNNQLEALKASI